MTDTKPEPTLSKQRPKASTSQILGKINGHKVNPKWREAYDTLLQLRDKLMKSKMDLVEETKQDHPSAFSLHMADAASDQYDQDMSLSMISSEQNAIYEIEQALNRIRDGAYGICEISGAEIELERLQAIPWTRYSAAAQRKLEENGAVSRHKLGQLESLADTAGSEEEDEEGE